MPCAIQTRRTCAMRRHGSASCWLPSSWRRSGRCHFPKMFRNRETQDPNLFAGYHHEWSPGVHTLLLTARLQDEFSLQDPNASALVTTKNGAGQIVGVSQPPEQLDYRSDLVAYSAELQQIFQS